MGCQSLATFFFCNFQLACILLYSRLMPLSIVPAILQPFSSWTTIKNSTRKRYWVLFYYSWDALVNRFAGVFFVPSYFNCKVKLWMIKINSMQSVKMGLGAFTFDWQARLGKSNCYSLCTRAPPFKRLMILGNPRLMRAAFVNPFQLFNQYHTNMKCENKVRVECNYGRMTFSDTVFTVYHSFEGECKCESKIYPQHKCQLGHRGNCPAI